MKILYINRKKSEYVQELLYTGLCKVIGTNNVIEMPWNPRMHLNHRPYPKNLSPFNFSNLLESVQAQFSLKNYDLLIVASCHPDTLKYYENIMDSVPKSIPRVFIDGGDFADIAGDLDRFNGTQLFQNIIKKHPFDFIFKREYLLNTDFESHIYPFPMAFNYDFEPKKQKNYKYDVCFWAVESDPIRSKALEILEDRYDCKKNGTHKNQIMKKYKRKGSFYLQELSQCKINLNFRGGGWDTLRFWEVLGMGGFLISQKPQIAIEPEFIDKEEIVYCKDDLSDLIELIDYYLEHEDERHRIAQKARIKMQHYHSDIARAKFLLQTISTKVNDAKE